MTRCPKKLSDLNCTSEEFRMRSYFRFDVSAVTQDDYRIPKGARLYFLQKHSALCDNGALNLYRASEFHSASGDTWNDQPTIYSSTLKTTPNANHGRDGCGGAANVDFPVKDYIDYAEANGDKHLYVGLRAPDESPSPDLRYWNRFDGAQSKIEVYYDIKPYYPKQLQINGLPCTADPASAPWITTRQPVLSASIDSKDSMVQWQARVRESGSGGAIEFDWTSGELGATGARRSKTVTASLPDDSYYWLARAISTSNSDIMSAWSPACRFNVDATKPTRPTITPTSDGPYTEGSTISLTLSSSDPLVNGAASGLNRYEYSWGTDTYADTETTTGDTTITKENLAPGRYVLYVRSADNAGNFSFSRTFTFFVGNDIPATPMATWRFEQDSFDDTGHGYDLLPVSGTVAYEADRDGRTASALTLDGQTCLSTDDADPATDDFVVRTDAAFSVSAWIRVDAASGYDKALVQAGAEHSAFQLQYGADEDQWYFSMLSAPGADFQWQSLSAPATAALGEWQHVAGTYDPDAGLMRIYVDGVLADEMQVSFTPWHESYALGVGCRLDAAGGTGNFVTGAIDQVGLWQGLLSGEQVRDSMTDLPTAIEQATWEFGDGGTDTSRYGRDIAVPAHVPVGEDAFERPSGAIELDGQTCLEYGEPVVDSARSFTAAAWVRTDSLEANATVVAIAGENRPGLRLRYTASEGKWQFVMHDADLPESESSWLTVLSAATVEPGRWYHLTGVYDAAANEMRFYVDGQLQGTRIGPAEPWDAAGATAVGCSAAGTNRWDYLNGMLHDVRFWRGPVDDAQIATMMGDPPAELAAWWALDTDGADWSNGGHSLTLVDNYSWTDGWEGTPEGAFALAFDGGGHAYTSGPIVATDEAFTMSAWVCPSNLDADRVAVSITGDSRGVIDLKYTYTAAGGAWSFAAPPTGDLDWRSATSTTAPTVDQWAFLVGVYDLRNSELRLYVNGKLAGTATGVVLPATSGPVTIGAEGNTDGTVRDGMVGAVDDAIIWSGALPKSTIAAMYNPDLVVGGELTCGP